MLETLTAGDFVLNQYPFMKDELKYNFIHLLCEFQKSTSLKTSDGRMIFAESPGHNAWLWLSEDVPYEQKLLLMQELIDYYRGKDLPEICGTPETAELFAKLYAEANHRKYSAYMHMETYSCPSLIKPAKVKGEMIQATQQHIQLAAEFLTGYSESAYGITLHPASQLPVAEGMVMRGNLYFWSVDHLPVAMASIAYRSPRHGRINAVYTSPGLRKSGYASAILAELCEKLEEENREAMLYADKKNIVYNKLYKNIGFVESGTIVKIRFQ
ncbi:hypothetical protein FHS15_004274 [Paenibacillus castaneae]|uniref:GNAT family N-acetyltransferase n=1 Tax=Paenibacillus castaneae TaxID=474957 RepID=UPI000C9D2259|nr:GNAT family N-acetyltransferase [Paenibacillus castaneae]NIK79116.1 hypothetical protein [Paenibacillus castaneae]